MKNITASPVPWRDTELWPLTERSIHAITLWIRGDFIQSVHESIKDEEDQSEWDRVMRLAFKTSLDIEWADSKVLLTKRGKAKLLQHSLKEDVSFDQCLVLIDDTFWSKFVLVNDMEDSDQSGSVNGKKKKEEVYRELFDHHGLLPTQLAEMTPTQLQVIVGLPPKIVFRNSEELTKWLKATRN